MLSRCMVVTLRGDITRDVMGVYEIPFYSFILYPGPYIFAENIYDQMFLSFMTPSPTVPNFLFFMAHYAKISFSPVIPCSLNYI